MGIKIAKLLMLVCLCTQFVSAEEAQVKVAKVLDEFHQAASDANGQKYFSLMTDNAVFIGTDASENWDKASFVAFAMPIFQQGKGWTYHPRDREITFATTGNVAWFVELLDSEKYGECRGTGVLELTEEGWKISQYHLTFPIPNAIAGSITEQIKSYQKAPQVN